jgi:hypothetical protein
VHALRSVELHPVKRSWYQPFSRCSSECMRAVFGCPTDIATKRSARAARSGGDNSLPHSQRRQSAQTAVSRIRRQGDSGQPARPRVSTP